MYFKKVNICYYEHLELHCASSISFMPLSNSILAASCGKFDSASGLVLILLEIFVVVDFRLFCHVCFYCVCGNSSSYSNFYKYCLCSHVLHFLC